MLVIEDLPCWDVDTIAGIRQVRDNPLWWKPKDGKPLRERLDDRAQNEERQKPRKA